MLIDRHRPLLAILAVAAVLHITGMIRSPLPSQDGLKFIRIAREFGHQPWLDVVRSADQHPLYPLLIAAGRPVVSFALGDGPRSWRVAAQGVSTLATLAMIPCAFIFSSVLVDRRSALLAALLLVLLPTTAQLGHETLSDATALSLAVASLALGSLAMTPGRVRLAVGSGFLAGLGYLARPEVALVPLAIAAGWGLHCAMPWIRSIRIPARYRVRPAVASISGAGDTNAKSTYRLMSVRRFSDSSPSSGRSPSARQPFEPHLRISSRTRAAVLATASAVDLLPTDATPAAISSRSPLSHERPARSLRGSEALRGVLLPILLLGPLMLMIGSYAAIKGSISEKLSVRFATGMGDGTGLARSAPPWMPPGLDDPRWDFSPKEEGDVPGQLTLAEASRLVARRVLESTAWVLLPLAAFGAWKRRGVAHCRPALVAVGLLAIGFASILVRHAMRTGYLSDRHCVLIVVAVLPLAALGVTGVARAIADRRNLTASCRRLLTISLLIVLTVVGFLPHLKSGHPSRWGHAQAGRWIAQRAGPGEAVLDTRGWAAFVSGLRSYGPWHIRQAISDSRLAYVVIGEDELSAGTRRAGTLKALLDFAAEPVAAFPEREGGSRVGVWVYRYTRPESWEAILR